MSKILFWGGFGLAVRFWQLGLEMRPFFAGKAIWGYPIFGAIGAGVGYWLTGVEQRQLKVMNQRREALLDKRRRRAERNGETWDPSRHERPSVGSSATALSSI